LIEKCDIEQDRHQIQDMLNELKNKWQSLYYQSVERQKLIEDALLCSGQFRERYKHYSIGWIKLNNFYMKINRLMEI
jgi:hypothetical protein